MLHWNQIWRYMYEQAGIPVERRAVMLIILHFENMLDSILEQSFVELKKINEKRKFQGLEPKKRLDDNCIKMAIKTLYPEKDMKLTYGGESQKIGEKNMHLPKGENREVEI